MRIVTPLSLFLLVLFNAVASAGEPRLELLLQTGHTDEVVGMALSGDGKYVVTASKDGTAILWDAASGKKLQYFEEPRQPPKPDEKFPLLQSDVLHASEFSAVAMTADGKRVVTLSRGWEHGLSKRVFAAATVWDAVSGKILHTFADAVTLSRDGKYVVTVGEPKEKAPGQSKVRPATLWETASGKRIQTFTA